MLPFLLFLSLVSCFSQLSFSKTILVDGVSEWKNPSVHVGDSIIFKHKYHFNLYIFQNQNAFNLCNFTQASLLTKYNSTSYAWHASRPGFFYFTFNNASLKACNDKTQKLPIKVFPATTPPLSPEVEAPAPNSGGNDEVPSSPGYPWPFRPREVTASSPSPGPSRGGFGVVSSPLTVPTIVPGDKNGNGMPFINSNPAVPLPTGEVDSSTIRPLSSFAFHHEVKVGAHMALLCAILVL